MTSLNLADNNIGQSVMSDGWQYDEDADEYWKEVEGEELVEKQLPAGEQLAIESPVGAIAIVNAIKDMRALTSLILAGNDLGQIVPPEGWRARDGDDGQAPWIHTDGRVEKGTPEGSKPEAIIAIANAIPDLGALSVLNLAENNLGDLVLPEGWTEDYDEDLETVYKHTDGREQKEDPGSKPQGIIAIANAIPDMRALTKLDISSNRIGAEQERDLQRICVAGGIELAK
jgi:hypothetical protein